MSLRFQRCRTKVISNRDLEIFFRRSFQCHAGGYILDKPMNYLPALVTAHDGYSGLLVLELSFTSMSRRWLYVYKSMNYPPASYEYFGVRVPELLFTYICYAYGYILGQ